jgi:hypothetical protein
LGPNPPLKSLYRFLKIYSRQTKGKSLAIIRMERNGKKKKKKSILNIKPLSDNVKEWH